MNSYRNTKYQIIDIAFNENSYSTFERAGHEITFVQYYKEAC